MDGKDGTPVGELCCQDLGEGTAQFGIKICQPSHQEKGYGKKLLSMLIGYLFSREYGKIVLDTNLENTRAQHVYEALGFHKIRVRQDCFKDQLDRPQSAVDYELVQADFCDFTKAKNH